MLQGISIYTFDTFLHLHHDIVSESITVSLLLSRGAVDEIILHGVDCGTCRPEWEKAVAIITTAVCLHGRSRHGIALVGTQFASSRT